MTGDPDEKDFTRLSLHWQPPLELNGHIVKYRIYYSTNVNASLKTWQAVEAEGSKLTKQITGLKPGTAYYFQMQAKTTKGWGPMSEKEEVSTLTGNIFVHDIFSFKLQGGMITGWNLTLFFLLCKITAC